MRNIDQTPRDESPEALEKRQSLFQGNEGAGSECWSQRNARSAPYTSQAEPLARWQRAPRARTRIEGRLNATADFAKARGGHRRRSGDGNCDTSYAYERVGAGDIYRDRYIRIRDNEVHSPPLAWTHWESGRAAKPPRNPPATPQRATQSLIPSLIGMTVDVVFVARVAARQFGALTQRWKSRNGSDLIGLL